MGSGGRGSRKARPGFARSTPSSGEAVSLRTSSGSLQHVTEQPPQLLRSSDMSTAAIAAQHLGQFKSRFYSDRDETDERSRHRPITQAHRELYSRKRPESKCSKNSHLCPPATAIRTATRTSPMRRAGALRRLEDSVILILRYFSFGFVSSPGSLLEKTMQQ